jgi:hypothetical protein
MTTLKEPSGAVVTSTPSLDRAAWRGADLAGRSDWIHVLAPTERDELVAAATTAQAAGLRPETLRAGDHRLPGLSPVSRAWADELEHGRGFVLVRGFPVEELDARGVELAYTILGTHLGAAVPQALDGKLIGHVRDDGSDPGDPRVRRYRTRLAQPFHVDDCDIVGLLCLQQAREGGLSRIVSSVTLHRLVAERRPDLEPLLHQPWYFDRYGQQSPDASPWVALPILLSSRGRSRFRYLRWYIDKAQSHPDVPRLTARQVELLDLIDALAGDPALHLDMDFRPGDVQLLANDSILHARTAYEDHDDPARKRHLLRLWLMLPRKDGG